MTSKFVAVISMLCPGFLLLIGQFAAAQEYSKTTPWGDPDLQGVWSYASLTPLQRPTRLEDKEFYTPEEAAEIFASTQQEPTDRPGDVGSYNYEWFDRGEVSADLRTSLIVDPPTGRLPLREDAVARQREQAAYTSEHPADSWLDRTNWDRCITYHGVPPVSSGYNNSYQIFQNKDFVAIYVEMIHDVRIIPIDDRPALDDRIRQWNGASRGYWDGDTLVVETANFSDKTSHRYPSSRNTRAVERYTRVSDDMIDYQFTIEDPTVYTQPWTAVRPMPKLDGYIQYEYACHEGNYAMTYILRGARIEEQRAKQGISEN
ncbi:MAG: hypothetical protein O2971_16250 [Proteobacteria bacterium]|nr:hypothetical protein [Pseudomonadota bacterium]